jgi:nucleotide-binding universal stress UspA family protein
MSIRNILVAFNGTPEAASAVRLAAMLAKQNNAHLTGLYPHSMPAQAFPMDAYVSQLVIDTLEGQEKENAVRVRSEFETLMQDEELTRRAEFFPVRGYPNDVIVRFARTYDLTVIAQPGDSPPDRFHEPDPDTIAVQSGRPIMIAPRSFLGGAVPRRSVLAWDGRRSAARAMSDAMTMLEGSEHVTVLHVGDETEVRGTGWDIMEHLGRHDIEAELEILPKNGRAVADIVLDTCLNKQAGLLVMGAYEHSRFSEAILGGVTRDVLRKTDTPVLLSH